MRLRIEFITNNKELRPAEKYFLITWLNKPAGTRINPQLANKGYEQITEETLRTMLNRFAKMGIARRVKLRRKSGQIAAFDYIIDEYKLLAMVLGHAYEIKGALRDRQLPSYCYNENGEYVEDGEIDFPDLESGVEHDYYLDLDALREMYYYENRAFVRYLKRMQRMGATLDDEHLELVMLDEEGNEPEPDNVVSFRKPMLFNLER